MQPYSMLIISVALSIVCYEDVEGRLRRHKSKLVTPILILCMVGLAVLAGCAYKSPASFSVIELEISNAISPPPQTSGNNTIEVAPPSAAPPVISGSVIDSMTTIAMVREAIADQDWNKGAGQKCPSDSIYVTAAKTPAPFPFDDPVSSSQSETCQVLNPGHETTGTLVVLGDSHADMSKARFVQLLQEATAKNEPFPTVVFKTRWGRAMLPCRPEFAANLEMLKVVKPQAALFVIHWVQYLNPGAPATRPYSDPPKCCLYEFKACQEQNMDDVAHIFAQFESGLKELTALGIKVYVVDQSPECKQMNPGNWLNGDTITKPAPISRAEWRTEKAWLLQPLHTSVRGANATLLDYADNYSKGDTLVVTDLEGYPVVGVSNHLSTNTARYHLSVLDQVVYAARLDN
ncbi:hypothetical protein ACHHYP_06569 [Achlya hypogyna]|uniref:SGNH domain-containing protein n=1 Tax=Achlya hypogyna TaxID=1202772 RepID=A0A1V9YTG1_ACHHY|nr:hypothetical protein ACHHYP_06569 [Achlya hypogyna]